MTLLFKQSVETNKEALCVKLESDRGIMLEVTMALLITCSFCPGEYVLFDMRACVHQHAHMRACDCTRMLRTDHVFLLSRRVCSLRNMRAHSQARMRASRVASVQASTFSSKSRRRRAEEEEESARGPEAAADAAPAAAAESGCDGVPGPPAPAAAGGAVDA